MRELIAWVLTAALTLGWIMDRQASPATADPLPASTATHQLFTLDALWARHAAADRPWMAFLEEPTLRVSLYALPPDGTDRQQPHDEDEVYLVLDGAATATVDGEDVPVQPGSVLYVKARADHRFHTITDSLRLLVFFSTASPTP